jgi:hypothetical protein
MSKTTSAKTSNTSLQLMKSPATPAITGASASTPGGYNHVMSEQITSESDMLPEVEKKERFDDLDRVGPDKPLGYLSLNALRNRNHEDPEEVMAQARKRGLFSEIINRDGPDSSVSEDGWLFVADLEALQKLLNKYSDLLVDYGWRLDDPVWFIHRITTSRGRARPKTKFFDLIADAYGDYDNPGRTDVDDEETDDHP